MFLPKDVKTPFIRECALRRRGHAGRRPHYGCGPRAAERGGPLGWHDVSTLKEPYRVEGKRRWPTSSPSRWTGAIQTGSSIHRRRHGHGGMWKAFEEMEAIGWISPQRRPRMVSVQADGCAPIVRAFNNGLDKAPMWEHAATWPTACASPSDRRLSRASRDSRERRHRRLGLRPGDGRRHAGDWCR